MKNRDKLEKLELAGKERYYYQRFGKSVGTATICLIPVPACDGNAIVRGVSFCSPRDQFNKRLGRDIALGRAIKAIEVGDDSDAVPVKSPAGILNNQGIFFLSAFNPELTYYEKQLIGKA